jgi:hypothetical protein
LVSSGIARERADLGAVCVEKNVNFYQLGETVSTALADWLSSDRNCENACVTPVALKSGGWAQNRDRRFLDGFAHTRIRRPATGLITLLLFLLVYCGVLLGQTSGKSMSLGSDSIHAGDSCLMLGATAESGDFFKGLRSRDTPNGRIFQKASARITSFPENLSVEIHAGFDSCAGKGAQTCDRCDFRFNTEFMRSLRFEIYWKRGLDMRNAIVTAESRDQSYDLAQYSEAGELWKYHVSVRSENVPLTDVLVVVILAPDGRIVSRLSGKL